MDSVPSTDRTGVGYLPTAARTLMKIVVTGPFGVGKTTLIRTLSEIATLHTEEAMTRSSIRFDDTAGLPDKITRWPLPSLPSLPQQWPGHRCRRGARAP
ncbi:hypothetical protein ACWC5G_35800, partial [Streptomyces sp. NPDC001274]